MIKDPKEILQEYWGFSSFKGSQEKIIEAVLAGTDVLALLPTGGGKSVCYQIPALTREGLCIVVSPLIALIHDQIDNLKSKGIKALALTGGIPFEEVIDILDNAVYGGYKFLYLSPERLQQDVVQERIAQMNINLAAIDEAHCISQWGNDFRPAYLNCSVLRELKPDIPIIALTATATSVVSADIVENLKLHEVLIFKDSFSRDNIAYKVLREEDKLYRLKRLCSDTPKSGIVYVRTRRSAEELSSFLNKNGVSADHFHGGISKNEKTQKLKQWLSDGIKIMVATNAFGMGVDKPDVSLVLHYQIPDSLENYFQESGRAGRDGGPAEAVIVLNKNDEVQVNRQFLSVLPNVPFLKLLYKKLNAYFQIPYSGGNNERFQFRLNEFCQQYDLNPILTYNGLSVLDQNSVLALSQSFSRHTKVRFLASKSQMLDYLRNNKPLVEVVQVILRTYGGVFDYETKINTLLIAKKAGLKEELILGILKQLSTDEIIDFQEQQGDLEITLLVPREDDLTINSFADRIEAYQKVKRDNVTSMLAFINNDKKCRNRQLLHYFGENKNENCGTCDVCVKNNKTRDNLQPGVISAIIQQLGTTELSSRRLIELLPYEGPKVLEALQILLEKGTIEVNSRNEYILTKPL